MPYFIYISGLFGLATGDGGLPMDPVHLRVGSNASQIFNVHPKENISADEKYKRLENPSYTQLPAATHAQLLLAKMCSGHPTAAVAVRLLEEAFINKTSPALYENKS